VSPGKSWEGGAAGTLAALLGSVALAYALPQVLPHPLALAGLAVVVAVAGHVGDLGVSMAKRRAGVKDTGGLLPGHGGLLDRVDSLTAATPAFLAAVLGAGL
jgi:phosphatidate cytidylyltransferase